jgi:alpha-L-arabinofuranosidase
VDAAKNLGQVSRYVFGTNFGPWALLNADVYPQFKESGLTLIRFPGGNWGDENDMEAWHFDMFMTLCRLINAEPLVSVRLRGGTV